uniref:Calmodulin-binding transcription activator 2 n=1 Tax=Ascaris suum TaxID=6253 RepID=F1LE13_ASCSU
MGSARFASCGYGAPPTYSTYREQRELYEAAKIIQHAYREYKARINSQRQNEAERNAAVVIQSYYRRYKQFCYFKKLHKAAVLIQKHFRMHRTLNCTEEHHIDEQLNGNCLRLVQANDDPHVSPLMKEHQAALTIQHAYRGHYQRKRQAAARKIQKFMRQSRQKYAVLHIDLHSACVIFAKIATLLRNSMF